MNLCREKTGREDASQHATTKKTAGQQREDPRRLECHFALFRNRPLKCLHESIDTTSSSGKLIFHVFGALAEFERNLIRERTQAGLAAARARGRRVGRPKSLDAAKRAFAVNLYDEKKHSVEEICEVMGVSKPTLYKYIKAARTETTRTWRCPWLINSRAVVRRNQVRRLSILGAACHGATRPSDSRRPRAVSRGSTMRFVEA